MARILAVEDEFLVRTLVVETLESEGHCVLDAPDGEAALSLVRQDCAIDLIVTDIRMPKLDGFGLALAARDVRPSIGVLFMTGYTGADPPQSLAFEKMLHKPFSPEDLISAVEELLAGRAARPLP
jgi:two-component system cell cycle response regulator CpdR